jgi:hypothetical protein
MRKQTSHFIVICKEYEFLLFGFACRHRRGLRVSVGQRCARAGHPVTFYDGAALCRGVQGEK